jgi:hypothetical protein
MPHIFILTKFIGVFGRFCYQITTLPLQIKSLIELLFLLFPLVIYTALLIIGLQKIKYFFLPVLLQKNGGKLQGFMDVIF